MADNTGALRMEDCPNHPGPCKCKPKCDRCGRRAHMAIHCGVIGNPNKPYGHRFTASVTRDLQKRGVKPNAR